MAFEKTEGQNQALESSVDFGNLSVGADEIKGLRSSSVPVEFVMMDCDFWNSERTNAGSTNSGSINSESTNAERAAGAPQGQFSWFREPVVAFVNPAEIKRFFGTERPTAEQINDAFYKQFSQRRKLGKEEKEEAIRSGRIWSDREQDAVLQLGGLYQAIRDAKDESWWFGNGEWISAAKVQEFLKTKENNR